MKIKNWIACVQNRGKWKRPNLSTIKGSSAPRRRREWENFNLYWLYINYQLDAL